MSIIEKKSEITFESSAQKYTLPSLNIDNLTQYGENVNPNNLKIYRDILKEINAPLNFLNQFIRNHLSELKKEGLQNRTILSSYDLNKKLINNEYRRKRISQILGIEIEIIEKEDRVLGSTRKALNIRPEELKIQILNEIEELDKQFRVLTKTQCKNFPLQKKDLEIKHLEEMIKTHKDLV